MHALHAFHFLLVGPAHLPIGHADLPHHLLHIAGRRQFALGVQEEIRCGDNVVSFFQTRQYFDLVFASTAQLHFGGHVHPLAFVKEHDLANPGIQHRFFRNDQPLLLIGLNQHIPIHAGLELEFGIRQFQPHPHRPRRLIQRRIDVLHLSLERFSGVGVEGRNRLLI